MLFIPDTNETQQDKELKRKRVMSMSGVFARALSVLSGRKITVNVVEDEFTKTPAWSSTAEIWLNLSQIKDDFTARSITSLNGLSFHELAHLRYTPRRGSTLVQQIESADNVKKLWEAFNCLEDSRIENLLIAYLPSIKGWITATIADYLLNEPSLMNRAFPLLYGRYYLPKEVRQLATDQYVNPDDLPELKSIIDEYTALIIDSTNADRAFELIKRFSELLDNLPPMPQDPNGEGEEGGCTITIRIPNPHGHSKRPTEGYESSSNRPTSRKNQERDLSGVLKNRDIVIDLTPKDKPKENKPEANTENKTSKEDSSNEFPSGNFGNDNGFPSGDFNNNLDDSSDDSDTDFDNDSDNQPNKNNGGKSAGNEEGVSGSNQQVTDTLNDVLKDVLDNLSKEINQIAKQLGITDTELDGGNAKEPERANYTEKVAPNELVELSRAFSRELERLRADYDPQWVRYRDNGKVNPLRYLRGDDTDTIFDEWAEGRDDVTEIEAVILLDKSGSMAGENADNAYKSMFVLKRALERVNARTTVCVFDYGTELLYSANEKSTNTIKDAGADGGTDPEKGLLYAKRILAETEKPIRILFLITDGQWETEEGQKAITEMRNAGVLTCQALIGFAGASRDYLESFRHNFELITPINSARELTKLGKELVRLAIKRNLTNV